MEHGHFHITELNNVLMVKLLGSFNHEGACLLTKVLKTASENFNDSPFGLLFDVTEFEGGTPDAYKELDIYNSWLNSQNMVAKATVISSRIQISIANLLSPARKQQNTESFFDLTDAQIWLNQELEQYMPTQPQLLQQQVAKA